MSSIDELMYLQPCAFSQHRDADQTRGGTEHDRQKIRRLEDQVSILSKATAYFNCPVQEVDVRER